MRPTAQRSSIFIAPSLPWSAPASCCTGMIRCRTRPPGESAAGAVARDANRVSQNGSRRVHDQLWPHLHHCARKARSRRSPSAMPTGTVGVFPTGGKRWSGGSGCPSSGGVCMDMCMLDVTDVPGVSEQDEVVLIGQQGEQRITADELARTIRARSPTKSCAASAAGCRGSIATELLRG